MSIFANFWFLMILILVGCYSCTKEKQLPIAEEQLIKILGDIHIAESAIDVMNGADKDSAAVKVYRQIYTIHQVDEADVDSCLSYLKRNPKAAEKIYGKVIDDLEKMKQKED